MSIVIIVCVVTIVCVVIIVCVVVIVCVDCCEYGKPVWAIGHTER
jgi:hypothetical protein